MVCRPENCPDTLGTCDVNTNTCVRKNGWKGLETYPKAWATYYCTLMPDGCLGVTTVPAVHRKDMSAARALPFLSTR